VETINMRVKVLDITIPAKSYIDTNIYKDIYPS